MTKEQRAETVEMYGRVAGGLLNLAVRLPEIASGFLEWRDKQAFKSGIKHVFHSRSAKSSLSAEEVYSKMIQIPAEGHFAFRATQAIVEEIPALRNYANSFGPPGGHW
jgi:hypothetical protein